MKADYGLRALVDLAAHYPGPAVPCHAIARRQEVPAAFLDQVLLCLRRHRLVASTRGPHGGHVLARPPGEIRLSEALAALEGPPPPMACFRAPAACQAAGRCRLRRALRAAEAAAQATLAETTLADLLPGEAPIPLVAGPAA